MVEDELLHDGMQRMARHLHITKAFDRRSWRRFEQIAHKILASVARAINADG